MAVSVECQRNRRMAQALLDLLRVGPLGDEKSGTSVAQIVEPIERTMAFLALAIRT